MKRMISLIVMFSCIIATTGVFADTKVMTSTTMKPMKPGNIVLPACPAGWKVASKTKAGWLTCVPLDPKKGIKCPAKYQYFFDGCKAGCRPIIY